MAAKYIWITGAALAACLTGYLFVEAAPSKTKEKTVAAVAVENKKSVAGAENSWDFQKDALNSSPGFGKSVAGTWTVLAEPDHPGNKVLAQTDTGKKMSVFLSRANYVNFEISLRLRTDMFEHQSHNWQMGLIFRNQDSSHFYKLRVSAANAALLLVAPPRASAVLAGTAGRSRQQTALTLTAKAGGEQLLFFFPLGTAKDQWQRLGIKARGENLSVFLNGREVQTLSDGGVGSGQFGFYTYNTRGYFDDITLNSSGLPKFSRGLAVDQDPFILSQAQSVMVYYYLPRDMEANLKVLDPKGQTYSVLTKGIHSYGVNSIEWDGQGLTSLRPSPGTYTLEMEVVGKTYPYHLKVLAKPEGKAMPL
jgi:hypothetical protein